MENDGLSRISGFSKVAINGGNFSIFSAALSGGRLFFVFSRSAIYLGHFSRWPNFGRPDYLPAFFLFLFDVAVFERCHQLLFALPQQGVRMALDPPHSVLDAIFHKNGGGNDHIQLGIVIY